MEMDRLLNTSTLEIKSEFFKYYHVIFINIVRNYPLRNLKHEI